MWVFTQNNELNDYHLWGPLSELLTALPLERNMRGPLSYSNEEEGGDKVDDWKSRKCELLLEVIDGLVMRC